MQVAAVSRIDLQSQLSYHVIANLSCDLLPTPQEPAEAERGHEVGGMARIRSQAATSSEVKCLCRENRGLQGSHACVVGFFDDAAGGCDEFVARDGRTCAAIRSFEQLSPQTIFKATQIRLSVDCRMFKASAACLRLRYRAAL